MVTDNKNLYSSALTLLLTNYIIALLLSWALFLHVQNERGGLTRCLMDLPKFSPLSKECRASSEQTEGFLSMASLQSRWASPPAHYPSWGNWWAGYFKSVKVAWPSKAFQGSKMLIYKEQPQKTSPNLQTFRYKPNSWSAALGSKK